MCWGFGRLAGAWVNTALGEALVGWLEWVQARRSRELSYQGCLGRMAGAGEGMQAGVSWGALNQEHLGKLAGADGGMIQGFQGAPC